MPSAPQPEQLLPWALRLVWVGVLVFGAAAIDSAGAASNGAAHSTAIWAGGAVWLIGVAAMAVPAVVSLTATRVIVPVSVPAALTCWMLGAQAIDAALFVAVASMSTLIAFSGEVGRAFVQASAYGDEDRHLLRPPAAYVLAVVLTWSVWAGCVLAGPLLLATGSWVLGSSLSAAAVIIGTWAWPRWHRLSRRWLVTVPIGLVLHDHLVLAETLMLRRQEIATVRLAPSGTQAADLTGPASGHAVEIVTVDPVTVIFAATPKQPRGRAIHLTACLISPTRPGRALTAIAARRLPIG